MNEELKKILSKLDSIEKRIQNLEERMDKLSEEWEIEELPPRQKEVLDFLMEHPEGLGVWDIAKARNISYSGSYQLLKKLQEKKLVEERWDSKGHSKKFYPKIK